MLTPTISLSVRVPAIEAPASDVVQTPSSLSVVDSTILSRDWLRIAESRGTALFQQPFPGEPNEVTTSQRADIWRMYLASNATVRNALDKREAKLKWIFLACSLIAFAGFAILLAWGFIMEISARNFLIFMGGAFGALISPMLVMSVYAYKISGLTDLSYEYASSRLWPSRLFHILSQLQENKLQLSLELRALMLLIKNYAPNWSLISKADTAALSTITDSLYQQSASLHEGSTLRLSGENSELVHRVCEAVAPGKLENIIRNLEKPTSIDI